MVPLGDTFYMGFDQYRVRAFGSLLALFFVPPLVYHLPFEGLWMFARMLALVPTCLWITLPAIPVDAMGLDWFEFQEFGAMARTPWAYALVSGFWLAIAWVMSSPMGRRARRRAAMRQLPIHERGEQ